METEKVQDGAGASLTLQVYNGRYYPTFPRDVIANLGSLKIRPDDVVLTGYLKAGCHWVWEILRMLLAGTTEVTCVEKDVAMIEQMDQAKIDGLSSPRVLNTHVLFDNLPKQVLEVKPRIVYLTRNPKDTCIALYNHHKKLAEYYEYKGDFANYPQLFLDGKVDYGSFFDHIDNWSKGVAANPELQVLEVNYEDLVENTSQKIRELAEFLEKPLSDDLLNGILRECSLESMRDRKGKFDLDSQGNAIMYRKGIVGDWKNWLTVEQNELFDKVYKEKMAQIQNRFNWRFELK